MVRSTFLAAAAALGAMAAVPSLSGQDLEDPFELRFRQLRPDIHLAYRPDVVRWIVEGNVTIIINQRDVVVVDGSGSPKSGRQVIEYIKRRTDKPVSVLVLTHGHGDHTLGTQEYLAEWPGIEIIARPETRDYLLAPEGGGRIDYVRQIARDTESRKKAGAEEIALLEAEGAPGYQEVVAQLRRYFEHDIDIRQQEYRKVDITPPTITVDNGITLHRGERDIQILHIGAGDTPGDLVVYLPQDSILITGDMLVEPIPYGFSRHPLEWAVTLDSLAAFDFELLIPGHGEVQHDTAYLDRMRALLAAARSEVEQAVAAGVSREEVAEAVDLSMFRDEYGGGDPYLRYLFDQYFAIPHSQRLWDALSR